MTFSRIHAPVGWTMLFVFLATGAYMRHIFPEAYEADSAVRFLYRSNHVYILFSSLLNILASYLNDVPLRWPKIFNLGSLFLSLSPVVLLAAFITETSIPSPTRPLTLSGASLSLGGVLLLVLSRRNARKD
ncbi:MAG: hypothetical protein A3H45_02435 [Ignavibacteria bacterium RIFCSPLOWO2_02_FULL_55_14]|nr:MAG: hypothetical protein A3C56_02500 [Ignavibacteria bacterium RIFCSPHIGHO2_02_FULL_56_12]OGU69645.1 MAG: hypothetical protein A3H45_02435 [Ignavibacteria bacterium RIFCSPLOWO2_02_FULL_55_14]